MPANRNDITHKPIYTATPDKPKFDAFDEDGDPAFIWAVNLEEAERHARAQGWTLAIHKEPSK